MALSQAYLEWQAKTLRQGEERGEQRGIQIGEQRGIQIGEQIGEQRMLREMLRWELEFKFGEQGLGLMPYVEAVETVADLYAFARSIKPLETWEAVWEWWLTYWEQGLGTGEAAIDRWCQGLGLTLKLQFPDADPATIAHQIEQMRSIAQTQTLEAAQAHWRSIGP
ncbi:MAG: hypothetical protein ACO331_03510 [Prochlorothrix sp.]